MRGKLDPQAVLFTVAVDLDQRVRCASIMDSKEPAQKRGSPLSAGDSKIITCNNRVQPYRKERCSGELARFSASC